MSYVIAVAKDGYSAVDETDPNSFIFHSSYNTFKIIRTGTITFSVATGAGQLFYEPHRLNFIPLVTGFAAESGYDQAIPPNSKNITGYGVLAGLFDTGLTFVSIAADDTNIIFKFDNTSGGKTVTIKYYCLETI